MHIIVDIDHTISHARWRDNLLGEWDEYHAASRDDKPLLSMRLLVNNLSGFGNRVIACTTRPEKWRTLTLDWLVEHGFLIEELWMRPDKDYRPSHEIKLEQILAAKLHPAETIIIDDREDVVAALAAAGYTVLQIFARD